MLQTAVMCENRNMGWGIDSRLSSKGERKFFRVFPDELFILRSTLQTGSLHKYQHFGILVVYCDFRV